MGASKLMNSAEIYDAFADHYRKYSETKTEYINSVDKLIIKSLKGKASNVLDFGAGDGIRGATLFNNLEGENLDQADVSDEMLKACKKIPITRDVIDLKQNNWNTHKQYDLIMMLWNVLGHVDSTQARIETLQKLSHALSPQGILCFDVNNRHYEGYGKFKCIKNRIIDFISPNFQRGDVQFNWDINGIKYPATGHFFTFYEIQHLLTAANLKIGKWFSIDYKSGMVSTKKTKGQLLFFASKC